MDRSITPQDVRICIDKLELTFLIIIKDVVVRKSIKTIDDALKWQKIYQSRLEIA